MRNVGLINSSALACAAAFGSVSVEAREPEPIADARSEVIVVTATKRPELLIDVPIAITVVGAEQLQNSGVSDIRELTALAPSIQFQTPGGGSDSSIRIRGIGTASTNPGLESSVGVVIDGVARARTGVALSELGDLERIEVLRGPQGTLFGRNTSSGLINVLTQRPDFRAVHGRLEGTLGNYGNIRAAGSINVPLPGRVALRIEAVNSYDAPNGTVILDVIVHDKMFSRIKAGPDSQRCSLERWIIDPVTRKIDRSTLDSAPQEFPRLDERRLGQPYRYAYTMAMTGWFLGSALYKHDFEARTRQTHDFGPHRHPCEFMFVPAHAQAGEDEGWLVGFVIDDSAKTTDLVILDARNFAAPPQASIRIPHIVPPGFHGNWLQNRA